MDQSESNDPISSLHSFLGKIQLTSEDLRTPAPGSLQTTRVSIGFASSDHVTAFVSGKKQVYQIETSISKENRGDPYQIQKLSGLSEKKIGNIHQHEIQTVKCDKVDGHQPVRIASIDSEGNAQVIQTQSSDENNLSYFLRMTRDSIQRVERGWTGIDFHPHSQNQVILASMMMKKLELFDGAQSIARINTPDHITGVSFCAAPIITITEGSHLSVYDLRSPSFSNPIRRISVSDGTLYCLDESQKNHIIGCGGSQRTTHILDTRKWSLLNSWVNCVKYEVISFHLTEETSQVCNIAGLDSEVLCGKWKRNSGGDKIHSFLGDSRWIGLDNSRDGTITAGMTEAGSFYVSVVERLIFV